MGTEVKQKEKVKHQLIDFAVQGVEKFFFKNYPMTIINRGKSL